MTRVVGLGTTRMVATATTIGVKGFGNETHRAILRLQGLDALGDVTIIDIAAVDFHEVLER
jgi:hypothetical protein